MFRLAWFLVRAAIWLGIGSLFMPAFAPRAIFPADVIDERQARDTLTAVDRVVSWHKPQSSFESHKRALR
jgi:hypothetical protein